MIPSYDILGLGCVAIDDLVYVAAYPAADSKAEVVQRDRQCGGLTGTALVTAARLGSSCVYAGTLGDDSLSLFVEEQLAQAGIDTRLICRRPGARPIHSTVIVDKSRQTRTIFYDLHGVLGAQADWPDAEIIRAARVVYVDHFGSEGMIRAAQIAGSAGIPVVADFESDQGPQFANLLQLVDHLILSQEFAMYLTDAADPERMLQRLWSPQRRVVIITDGPDGCWVKNADTFGFIHYPAFSVTAVDTTGCGDVFHGAYASALARGLDLVSRIRFASAAAALKATQRGGQAGIPTLARVEAFLEERSQ